MCKWILAGRKMTQYMFQHKLEYIPSRGVLDARLFLSNPELEAELEEIVSANFKLIGNPYKKETLTHKTTKYFLKEEVPLKTSVFERGMYMLAKLFSKEPKENKPFCTIQEIYDQAQRLPRMDIKVKLPVNGRDAERNIKLIQNLGEKLEMIYQKTQAQYFSGSGSSMQPQ